MTKPIPDKAEIALEYPDKLYVHTFKGSSIEAHLDPTGIALILERPGVSDDVRKSIGVRSSFGLFADILRELASTVGRIPKDDILHHDQLAQAVTELHRALVGPAKQRTKAGAFLRPTGDRLNSGMSWHKADISIVHRKCPLQISDMTYCGRTCPLLTQSGHEQNRRDLSMVAEALPPHCVVSVWPTVAPRGPRHRQSTQHMARGLAGVHHSPWLADDDRWLIRIVLPQVAIAGSSIVAVSAIVIALVVGALGAFLVKGSCDRNAADDATKPVRLTPQRSCLATTELGRDTRWHVAQDTISECLAMSQTIAAVAGHEPDI